MAMEITIHPHSDLEFLCVGKNDFLSELRRKREREGK